MARTGNSVNPVGQEYTIDVAVRCGARVPQRWGGGVLVGLAYGEALGRPVEFRSAGSISIASGMPI